MWAYRKSETINAADLGRRLVIQWTAQLPENGTATGDTASNQETVRPLASG
jgi:hypothetical protein